MRAARLGIFYKDALICGLACSSWISLMEETYSFSSMGYQFNGWPDGRSLMDQEQCVVDLLKITLSEKIKDIQNG